MLTSPAMQVSVAHPRVVSCYDLLAIAQLDRDLTVDYTDGRYKPGSGNDRAAYIAAQAAQAEFLLDQINCWPGSHILDIGCGHGRILKAAIARGASAVGITISSPQAAYCWQQGLDVRLLNYRLLGHDWDDTCTGLVANGSLEHFAQVSDAVVGRVDDVYREMFEICHRVVRPDGRFATTAIHFREVNQIDARGMQHGHKSFRRGTDEFHFGMLFTDILGCWYPEPGQLERCADGLFKLVYDEDGTHDYYLTSEYWLRRAWKSLMTTPRMWSFTFRNLFRDYRSTVNMVKALLFSQSWNWQFRGENPPTRLLRHTWQAL